MVNVGPVSIYLHHKSSIYLRKTHTNLHSRNTQRHNQGKIHGYLVGFKNAEIIEPQCFQPTKYRAYGSENEEQHTINRPGHGHPFITNLSILPCFSQWSSPQHPSRAFSVAIQNICKNMMICDPIQEKGY